MVDLPNKDIGCHRTGFTRKCRELVASGECNRWMTVRGQHPNTGEDINRSDCIDNWTPTLLMENSKLQRETGAAVESFRNQFMAAAGFPDGVEPAPRVVGPSAVKALP